MINFKTGIIIDKPIDIVYQAFIDPDNMVKWTTDLEKFEIVKGKFGEIGATARLYYRQKGRINIMEDKLEYIEPGKKLISSVTGEGLTARVETNFKALNGSTEVVIHWSGKPTIFLLKLLLPFLKNKIKKGAQEELNRFKNLVEHYGSKFK